MSQPRPFHTNPVLWRRYSILLAVLLGAVRTWHVRHLMNPGGVAFLDMADALRRGEWQNLVNGYWQPLYAVLLATAKAALPVSLYWEAAIAHLVNYGLFLACLAAFGWFWKSTWKLLEVRRLEEDSAERLPVPEWAFVALGYGWFIWSSLDLIGVRELTPDLLVATLVYLASGLLVRIRLKPNRALPFGLLGAALGLGYLAKAFMFPLALAYLALAYLAARGTAHTLARTIGATGAWLLISSLLIIPLSVTKGRPTIGDTGRLVHAWFVNDVRRYAHWQGEPPGHGIPQHPTRRILDRPEVFEFAAPVPGTLPTWFDPSYWHDGLEPHIDLRKQARAVLRALEVYYDLYLRVQGEVLVCAVVLALGWARIRGRTPWTDVLILSAPGAAAFALYAPVHAEPRFLGAFLVLLLAGLVSTVRTPANLPKTLVTATTLALVGLNLVRMGAGTVRQLVRERGGGTNYQWAVAQAARAMGIEPGATIGYLGYAYGAYWAHLIGVRVIAEVPGDRLEDFFRADDEGRQRVLAALAQAGATAIATQQAPPEGPGPGWSRMGTTSAWVYLLPTPSGPVDTVRARN